MIKIILAKIYNHIICKKIKKIGKHTFFSKNCNLKNIQYFEIGSECYFGPECRIEAWDEYAGEKFSPSIVIGDKVKINSKCHLGAINSIKIGSGCLFGSNVFITDHSHGNVSIEEVDIAPTERKLFSKGEVSIGENCWIGENVVILPNVHIGKSVIIGASSVVTKSIPDNCVVAGNPARVIKYL